MGTSNQKTIILGAGMTGLAAGFSSGCKVYESTDVPGGLCGSYYIRPGESKRLHSPPLDGEAYRFEVGGGHWIWGNDFPVLSFIQRLVPLKPYKRMASAYFIDRDLMVPYPIQHNLNCFGPEIAGRVLSEIIQSNTNSGRVATLTDWSETHFGSTLNDIFFHPYNLRYTAGLAPMISPQDSNKSPLDIQRVIGGALGLNSGSAGYNEYFFYPTDGLDALARAFADRSFVQYWKHAARIDLDKKAINFSDGSAVVFDNLISTLPLDRVLCLAGIDMQEDADPFTSVLVTNIGAKRGTHCPKEHWVYIVSENCCFHRVGFYSNVDPSFLPRSARREGARLSMYVETAYAGGQRPTPAEAESLSSKILKELSDWGWIGETEVVDSTWVETAYTWTRPMSHWADRSLNFLTELGIYQIGRYGRWASKVTEQSMMYSIREGLLTGACFKKFG